MVVKSQEFNKIQSTQKTTAALRRPQNDILYLKRGSYHDTDDMIHSHNNK